MPWFFSTTVTYITYFLAFWGFLLQAITISAEIAAQHFLKPVSCRVLFALGALLLIGDWHYFHELSNACGLSQRQLISSEIPPERIDSKEQNLVCREIVPQRPSFLVIGYMMPTIELLKRYSRDYLIRASVLSVSFLVAVVGYLRRRTSTEESRSRNRATFADYALALGGTISLMLMVVPLIAVIARALLTRP